ncbi:MAG: ATP-binding cassette domain-containing protein [Collinsella sp.]|nr:ATP-binding cassette domain-containing protein [Collinsella sp.]
MFDSSVFKLPGAGRTAVLLALLSLAGALVAVTQAWAICTVLAGLWAGEGIEGKLGLLAAFAACFVAARVLEAARDWLLKGFAAARAGELRRQALERLLEGRAVAGQGGAGAGAAEGTALVIEGAEQVEAYLALALGKAIDLAIIPVVLLVALFVLDPVSAVISLVAFPFIIFYMIMIGRNAHEVAAARQEEQARLSNHFLDALRGLDTLRLFGRARGHAGSIFAVSESLREATMTTLRTAMLSSAILDLFATLALAGVSVMLGFRLIDGWIGLYPALMALVLVPEYFRPVRLFAADYHATLDGKQALARMRALVDAPRRAAAEVPTGAWGERSELAVRGVTVVYGAAPGEGAAAADAGDGDDAAAVAAGAGDGDDAAAVAAGAAGSSDATAPDGAAPATPTGATPAPDPAPAAATPVSASPSPTGHRALSDLSLTLTGFERVGVVGASGSGKSTLVSLLAGFLDPAAGSFGLSWDGPAATAAPDLPNLLAPVWQRQVLYIPQKPYLFHASIAENIAFYAPDASRADIADAAEAAGLTELIAGLPDGFDTVIGDGAGARELSGGEAQRIALARAWTDRSRRVLLFDEPTAHLDIETELELKERMLPLMAGRLVVFATHRMHWLYEMDRVIVLAGGRVAAEGDPRELLARGVIGESLGLDAATEDGGRQGGAR